MDLNQLSIGRGWRRAIRGNQDAEPLIFLSCFIRRCHRFTQIIDESLVLEALGSKVDEQTPVQTGGFQVVDERFQDLVLSTNAKADKEKRSITINVEDKTMDRIKTAIISSLFEFVSK